MGYYALLSLPTVTFAHTFRSDTYSNKFPTSTNFVEISYIADGEVHLTIDDRTLHARKGDLLCLFHEKIIFSQAEKSHCHHTVGFHVDWRMAEDISQGLLLPQLIPEKAGVQTACDLIDELIRNQVQYITTPVKGAAKLLELVCEIDRICRKMLEAKIPSEQLYTQRAKEFIQHNLPVPITLSAVAKHLGISPEYLCTVFKKNEGVTIKRYINQMKLERIKILMEDKQLRLYEAAAVYGYSDPNYVSRLYKQFFGKNITDSDDQNLQT